MPERIEDSYPTVSIDRAAGLYYQRFDFNPNDVSNFYDGLSFENKRPLNQCHIHFSALAVNERFGTVLGMYYPDKSKNGFHDPQTPEHADIVIFLGSNILAGHDIHENLGHELVHYAEGGKGRTISEKERVLRIEHRILTSRKLTVSHFALKNAALGSLLFAVDEQIGADPTLPKVAAQLVSLQVGSMLFNKLRRKKPFKKKRKEEIEAEILRLYQSDDSEVKADQHGNRISSTTLSLTKITPFPEVLLRKRGKNRIIDAIHRRASLGKQTLPVATKPVT